jgi:acetyltransferase-like isoleucine patch superfamily enzyme
MPPRLNSSIFHRLLLKIVHRISVWQREVELLHSRQLLSRMGACGIGCDLKGRCYITGSARMQLGNNVHIGDNAFIRAEGGLKIGDNTHISRNLVLYTFNHRWEGKRIPYDDQLVYKPVLIGRNVWIGMNVCISPGSVIGDGAIIGIGCVVSGEVPSLTVVGNQKWRIIGQRDEALYRKLDEANAYGAHDGKLFEMHGE